MNTAQRLGYAPDARLLIVNADDFGMCHATNEGVFELLEDGSVDSATVMMPCGWAREAALWSAARPHLDVGVHFTLTSEWQGYKWGPVIRQGDASSLVTGEGYFPADCRTVELLADPAQVRAELIAQLEMAKSLGLDPTHVDNHMGSVYGLETGRHFLREVFEVCAAYGLPFRIPRRAPENRGATPEREQQAQRLAAFADQLGVVILDELVGLPFGSTPGETYESFKADMIRLLHGLRPGLNELILHPSRVTEELKAIHPLWAKRGWERDIFRDADVRRALSDAGIVRVKWSDLRRLQRGS